MSGSVNDPTWEVPGFMPVLSRGRHRRPRNGACFMEFASYLAGERWSDHPECTHPLLAFLARGVNDFVSDRGRQRLAPLVPSVVGLNGLGAEIDIVIAARAAVVASPVANESRQRALAAGVIACERAAERLPQRPALLGELVQEAESQVPLAMRWAREFSRDIRPPRNETFTRRGRAIVSTAVLGASEACDGEADAVLTAMLDLAIRDTELLVQGTSRPAEQSQPLSPAMR